MSTVTDRTARTDAPVLDVFAQRWSTRVFDTTAVLDEDAFTSALEAARWAPSAMNTQPWRFLVARRGTDEFSAMVGALAGFNQQWAPSASALVVVVAEEITEDGSPLPWAVYDTGQAAAYFTIQAHANGLYTHQMGGFDRAAVSSAFGLEERFLPVAVVAVGVLGDSEQADPAIRERESAPRVRRPRTESTLVDA